MKIRWRSLESSSSLQWADRILGAWEIEYWTVLMYWWDFWRDLQKNAFSHYTSTNSKWKQTNVCKLQFYHQVLAIKQPWMIVTALVEIRNIMFSFTFQSNQNQKLLRLCLKYWITNELFVQNIKLWKFLDSMWCATNQTQTQWQV